MPRNNPAPPSPTPEGTPKALDIAADFPPVSPKEWRETVEADLKGADFEKRLVWKTLEGIAVQPLYTREDAKDLTLSDGLPGFPPYHRGTLPLSGVRPSWQVRQDMMLATPEEVNQALRDGIARGQTAVGIRLDNAARRGLDGDSPDATELAGRGGCTLSSINGLRVALQDIDLTRHPVTIRGGTAGLAVLAILLAYADERGLRRSTLVGAVECDPLRELAKFGRVRGSLDAQYDEMAAMVRTSAADCPGIRTVMVNSHIYHNAGASAVQELGCALAAGTEYLRALVRRGIDVDTAALATLFSFSVSSNVFVEIAKLRAARALWAKITKAAGAENEDALRMFLHVRTSTFNKSAYDPYNNMVRTAVESFAAAVGGCDSMYVAPFDEPVGRPNEFSMRVARNQQLVLQEEAGLSRVADPAAGSWYVDSLTDSIACEAWAFFQEIEAAGGMSQALAKGLVQERIGSTAERRRQLVSSRREPIVGVTNYPNAKENPPQARHVPRQEFLAERRARLIRLKALRSSSKIRERLAAITTAMRKGDSNLMEIAVHAANDGATIGEITSALTRAGDQTSVEVAPLVTERLSAPFEALRDRANLHRKVHGALPRAFLVPMGPLAMRRARADFSHGFLGAGGIQAFEPAAFASVEDATKAAADDSAKLFVLCADDPSYPEIAPAFVEKVRAAKKDALVYVAGYPADSVEALRKAGVDGFIHIKADLLKELTALHERLGIGT